MRSGRPGCPWPWSRPGVRRRATELIAVLSGAGIRRSLLHAAGKAGLLGGRQTPAVVDAALDNLAGLSLLTFSLDGQVIIADGTVAQIVRDGLSGRQLAEVCRAPRHCWSPGRGRWPDRLIGWP